METLETLYEKEDGKLKIITRSADRVSLEELRRERDLYTQNLEWNEKNYNDTKSNYLSIIQELDLKISKAEELGVVEEVVPQANETTEQPDQEIVDDSVTE